MGHWWPTQEIELRHFAPSEFDRPDMMRREFLLLIDELRERTGRGIKVNDDGRTDADMEALYGPDQGRWPDSAHPYGAAIDCEPVPNTGRNRLVLVGEAYKMCEAGLWPRLGIEIADAHIHLDNHPNTDRSRPYIWIGVSK